MKPGLASNFVWLKMTLGLFGAEDGTSVWSMPGEQSRYQVDCALSLLSLMCPPHTVALDSAWGPTPHTSPSSLAVEFPQLCRGIFLPEEVGPWRTINLPRFVDHAEAYLGVLIFLINRSQIVHD